MISWTELAQGFGEKNEHDLIEFIQRQRWFGGKSRGVSGIHLLDHVVLRDLPQLYLLLIEVRYAAGTSDVFQLVVQMQDHNLRPDEASVITVVDDLTMSEAKNDPTVAKLLIAAHREMGTVQGQAGAVQFRSIHHFDGDGDSVRTLGAEQSNSSSVFDDKLLIKTYRRLEAGANPELELLLFLTEHGFSHIPTLSGWYSYEGAAIRSTLGVAQYFLPAAIDGWELGLRSITKQPAQYIDQLALLGTVIGEMHTVLASDTIDPDFAPEFPTDETTAIIGANLEERIELVAQLVPDGRSDELRTLAHETTVHPIEGRLIRSHGDLHLGQVLWSNDDWTVIDFEGEPARTLSERRQKFHPLRDVAGMLRSFSYLVTAAGSNGEDKLASLESLARERFLESYRAAVAEAEVVTEDLATQARVLRIFELEKLLYELDYEAQHRPDWLSVPQRGIVQLLDEQSR